MYLIGDIGNTESIIFLFNRNFKIINRTILKTSLINKIYLTKQSGIYFPIHLCERVSQEEVATASKALIDMVCFCNAHHT